jgi:hypothetical protein
VHQQCWRHRDCQLIEASQVGLVVLDCLWWVRQIQEAGSSMFASRHQHPIDGFNMMGAELSQLWLADDLILHLLVFITAMVLHDCLEK